MNKILKYCLIAFYLSLSCNLFAQGFISEAKLWRYGAKIFSEPCCGHRNDAFKFMGDSIIDDTAYVKLYTTTDEFLGKWQLDGLWRETNDMKIYTRDLFYQTEELLYDFSLVEGDTFNVGFATLKVDSVLTKLWGGKLRKHWYLYPVHAVGDTIREWNKTLWIEDVGQINYFPSNVGTNYGSKLFLLCFDENNQQIYHNPEYNTCFYTSLNDIPKPEKGFKVYPNPVSGELFVQMNSPIGKPYTLELYSIKGELIRTECLEAGSMLCRIDTGSLRNGIYILRLISDSGNYDEKVIVKK